MYMANARNLRLGPNPTYIPLTRVANFFMHDVGIFALGDAKVPNTNGFASQWNIGFSVCENRFILSRVTRSPPLGSLTGGPDVKCQF